jgi:hypothetical protein
MSLAQPIREVEYPESDGKPMGETDLDRAWMNRIYELLAPPLCGPTGLRRLQPAGLLCRREPV